MDITVKELPDFKLEFIRRAVSIDIETDGLDPEKNQILAIGIKTSTNIRLICKDGEKQTLEAFAAWFNKQVGIWIVGHNIITFDLPFIVRKCEKHSVEIALRYSRGQDGNIITRQFRKNGNEVIYYKSFWSKRYEIIDTLFLTMLWDSVHAALPDLSLKTAVIEMGLRKERRLELSPAEIVASYRGDRKTLAEYLRYDLEDAYMLGERLLLPYYYMGTIVPQRLQEITLSTTAKKVELLLEHWYGKNKPLPTPDDVSEKIAGAVTQCVLGLYTGVFKIDVSSLYPSIMRQYECYPTKKDPDKAFLKYLNYLTEQRLYHKKLSGESIESAGINEAYKILINSFFGFLASRHPYNDVFQAERVTAFGRKILAHMGNLLHKQDCQILESDTDGIIAKSRSIAPTAVVSYINANMPTGINVEHEMDAEWIYLHGKKNYIYSSLGKLKKKGIYVKRDRCPIFLEYTLGAINAALQTKKLFVEHYRQLYTDIMSGQIPIEKLTFRRRIAVTWIRLLTLGKPGDKISYYEGFNMAGEAVPTNQGPYNTIFYSKSLRSWADEMFQNIYHEKFMPDGGLKTFNLFEREEVKIEEMTVDNLLDDGILTVK